MNLYVNAQTFPELKSLGSSRYEFQWKPYSPEPCFRNSEGRELKITVENFVPMLQSDGHHQGGVCLPVVEQPPADETSLSEIPDIASEGGDGNITVWERILEGGKTTHDDEIDDEEHPIDVKTTKVDDANEELEMKINADLGTDRLKRMILHLPKCSSCDVCSRAKQAKSQSRRRKTLRCTVDCTEEESKRFGTCVHMDHIVMEKGSEAAKVARCALVMTDEKTDFKCIFPGNSKNADSIVNCVHQVEGGNPCIRRWWTDSAPEFAKAASTIRSQRPLAHYQTVPYRPEANGIAERANRLIVEGGRCNLIQSGLPDAWWTMATKHWVVNYNATWKDKNGLTPWERRFEEQASFVAYPFGAMVEVKLSLKDPLVEKGKWTSRLIQAILVGVTTGPEMGWARSYLVVPLVKILSDSRASKVCVKKVSDVLFPDVPVFPLRQKLTLHGAIMGELPGASRTNGGRPVG